jgi:suppressor for copper-sensitivity B
VTLEDHWHVNSNTPSYDYLIPTELILDLPPGSSETDLLYPAHSMQEFPFTEGPIAVYDGTFDIFADFSLPQSLPEGSLILDATLRYQACDDKQCLPPVNTEAQIELLIGFGGTSIAFDAPVIEAPTPTAVAETAAPTTETGKAGRGLFGMLLLGLLGGLLLNAMPCVLPVLSIKIFGLVKSAGQGRGQLWVAAFATTAGILVSFWVLALGIVLAVGAGQAVGWGIQFQYPGFVTFLAVIVVLFSLNMWGLFEIPLPAALSRVTGGSQKEGLAGHFFSGLFTTLMATPCSAPFLGTAVGFALAESPFTIFAIFTAIGLGLALPYVLIAAVPKAIDLLPRPGAWMVTFRSVMGFLLAAAAVWLFYVLAAQVSPERLAAIQLALLLLALAAWLFGKATPGGGGRRFALVAMLLSAAFTVYLAANAPAASATTTVEVGDGIDWLRFDEQEALRLAEEEGRLVFVDFTADWCLTCKANERLVIETAAVRSAFERYDVVPMKGDWTNRDDAITEFLARYGRSAVPFYILFRPDQEPYAFGELLSREAILEALEASSSPIAERDL